MIIPQSPSEKILFSTVRIEVVLSDGKKGVGTGFFFNFPYEGDKAIQCVITNKHVVSNAICASFQLHEALIVDGTLQPSGRFFAVSISNIKKHIIIHSGDVDLCAIPIQTLIIQAQLVKKSDVFYCPLDATIIPSDTTLESLSAIEGVFTVGYPIGLWDEKNNLPIQRRGITATHPAMDFNGRPKALIDAACFGGCSGSPVLIVNEGLHITRTEIVAGDRVILLGVFSSIAELNTRGEIIIQDIPIRTVSTAQISFPINLGYYIKAKEILALGETVRQTIEPTTPIIRSPIF